MGLHLCRGGCMSLVAKGGKPALVYRSVGLVCGYKLKLDSGCIIATFRNEPERQQGRKIFPRGTAASRSSNLPGRRGGLGRGNTCFPGQCHVWSSGKGPGNKGTGPPETRSSGIEARGRTYYSKHKVGRFLLHMGMSIRKHPL